VNRAGATPSAISTSGVWPDALHWDPGVPECSECVGFCQPDEWDEEAGYGTSSAIRAEDPCYSACANAA
jgi:hypothetical protein